MMNLDHPWQRVTGLIVLLACLALYQPGVAGLANQLIYPLLMAAGAWALVQNITAVALAGTLLAILHARPGAEDWIPALAYPALAVLGATVLAVVMIRRFRRRIAETHEARWSERRRR